MTPTPQESDLLLDLEHDSRLPQHEFDSEFGATDKYQKMSRVHRHTPDLRVCTEGFDFGRRGSPGLRDPRASGLLTMGRTDGL